MTIDYDLSKIKLTPLVDTLILDKIEDDVYFSKEYKDYISNSRLGVLKKDGVAAFFKGIPQSFESFFTFGSNIHALYLQPELFELIEGVHCPTAKSGLMANYLYKPDGTMPTREEVTVAAILYDYYKGKLTDNRYNEFLNAAYPYWKNRFLYEQSHPKSEKTRIFTDEKSCETLKGCLNAVTSNNQFTKLIHPTGIIEEPYSVNEQAILLDLLVEVPGYDSTVFKLKAKLDNFTIDSEENIITVNDLKTYSSFYGFDIKKFSYQRELAFYTFLLKLVAKKFFNLDNPTIKGNFLTVATSPPYDTAVVPMTPTLYSEGWKEVQYLLKVVAYFNVIKGFEFGKVQIKT